MKKKVLLTSVLTIALCLTLIVGSTYALFTSGNAVNVAVTAGKVNVVATIDSDLVTRSLEDADTHNRGGDFSNGGYAKLNGGELEIAYMTPGDVVEFTINVQNNSNVAMKYRVIAKAVVDGTAVDLSDALVIDTTVNNAAMDTMSAVDKEFTSKWIKVEAPNHVGDAITPITVTVKFPNGFADDTTDDAGNVIKGDNFYQGAKCKLVFTVEAVQANGVEGDYGTLITPTNP